MNEYGWWKRLATRIGIWKILHHRHVVDDIKSRTGQQHFHINSNYNRIPKVMAKKFNIEKGLFWMKMWSNVKKCACCQFSFVTHKNNLINISTKLTYTQIYGPVFVYKSNSVGEHVCGGVYMLTVFEQKHTHNNIHIINPKIKRG